MMGRLTMTVITILLVVLGIAVSIGHFFAPHYNPGFDVYPGVVGAHVVFGALYLLFGVLQFSPMIRRRWIVWHRWSGRALVAVALVTGVTALFIAMMIPFSGNPERVIIGFFGTLFLVSIVQAVINVRRGKIDRHREWMIRAFAIGTSIVTMRLIFVPLLMIMKPAELAETARYSIIAFSIAFVVHSTVAELWIRSTRRRTVRTPMP